jgi:hypothetical protein
MTMDVRMMLKTPVYYLTVGTLQYPARKDTLFTESDGVNDGNKPVQYLLLKRDYQITPMWFIAR